MQFHKLKPKVVSYRNYKNFSNNIFLKSLNSELSKYSLSPAMREKCPNTDFFLVLIFLYSVRIRKIRTRKDSAFGHFSRSADENDFDRFCQIYTDTLNKYAPHKTKPIRGNHSLFINKEISKAIIKQTQLINIYLKFRIMRVNLHL